jgi:uncharacterized repeat protein (TIGR03803 family)
MKSPTRCAFALIVVAFTCLTQLSSAQTLSTLHDFKGADGSLPFAGLTFDTLGNLYGTTSSGGAHGAGTVFQLSPNGTGWTFTTIYSFNLQPDGKIPQASLAIDSAGNLYGTTANGGGGKNGTVFELSPAGGGAWTYKQLYAFTVSPDGAGPVGNVILDAQGNLYGTTTGGGAAGSGTVFELSPNGAGGWNESVLYSFQGGSDGSGPQGGLVFDAAGNLYSTTEFGGASDQGTVFQLTPIGGGSWRETVLTSLNSRTGYHPVAGLAIDAKGNLFGTTISKSTVFELSPLGNGKWAKKVIHTFGSIQGDGSLPEVPVTVGPNGTLYGSPLSGGNQPCLCGTVYQLTRSNGTWTETILYNFTVQGLDEPRGAVALDAAGNIYGTTKYGNTANGSVFELALH